MDDAENMRIIREDITQHIEKVMAGVSTLFTPDILKDVEEIKRKHAEEWERVKDRPFTI